MSDTLLTFIHISDTHISDDPEYNVKDARYRPLQGAQALVKAIQDLPFQADFILHTGDVVYDPHETPYQLVKETFAPLSMPIYYLAGNHDHNDALQSRLIGREDIIPYLHYEFEVNGVQIVCVDSNGPAPIPAGFVTDEQLTWLEGICSADDDRPLIIATHHNPIPIGVTWLDNWMRMTNGLEFHEIVKKARNRLVGVFHGHIHQNVTVYREGILYSVASSSWYQMHGYPASNDVIADDIAKPGFSVVMVQRNQSYIRRYWFDV